MQSATRQTLIAGTAALGSATAAALTCALLVLGLPPGSWPSLELVVPGLFGFDVIAVVALVPTVVVSAGIALAVFLETARQVFDVHQRRLELEDQALERAE